MVEVYLLLATPPVHEMSYNRMSGGSTENLVWWQFILSRLIKVGGPAGKYVYIIYEINSELGRRYIKSLCVACSRDTLNVKFTHTHTHTHVT